jgi:hypothetical protein
VSEQQTNVVVRVRPADPVFAAYQKHKALHSLLVLYQQLEADLRGRAPYRTNEELAAEIGLKAVSIERGLRILRQLAREPCAQRTWRRGCAPHSSIDGYAVRTVRQ